MVALNPADAHAVPGATGRLIAVTRAELSGFLEVLPSVAGMHLVGWLDPTTDEGPVAARAARVGAEVRSLSAHALQAWPRPGLLLGYTAWTTQEIQYGVRRLAQALGPASAAS